MGAKDPRNCERPEKIQAEDSLPACRFHRMARDFTGWKDQERMNAQGMTKYQ